MKMDLETLARIVEERVPTAKAICFPEANQIVVTFTQRPDIEVALLTPWFQKQIKKGDLELPELREIIESVMRLV